MEPHSFAVRMLVEIRTGDKPEVLDFESLTQSFEYNELKEQEESLLDQLEFPEAEGLYHVFLFGHAKFVCSSHFEYGEEWDEELYVDSSIVQIASEFEYTAMEVKWDCTLPRPPQVSPVLPFLSTPNSHWPDQPVTTKTKEQQMEQQTAIKMADVDSSQISQMGHDPVAKVMRVAFKNGAAYRYGNVPVELYNNIIDAPSVGSAFSAQIKKFPEAFPFSKE